MSARTVCILGWFAAAIAAAGARAQAPIVTTVLNNGPTSSRYDLVILGDGYQAQEQARFQNDVTAFLGGLFQKAPYSAFAAYFNVHTVFRSSIDSGATHPDATPPILRNTAYGASYNTGGTARCLYITNTGLALADAALAPANETRVLVMVNDSRYGGCAGQFAVSYNGASMIEVQSHEMGHAVAQLADEYDYPNGNYTGNEPGQVNITANSVGQKWSHWWGTEGVSAFQGAGYHQTGLWRPRIDCLMRSLGVPNCPVCREQITRTVNAVVDTIESPQPSQSPVTVVRPAAQTFSFTNLVPAAHNPLVTWSLDGVPIQGQSATSYSLATAAMTVGLHSLTVEVRDQTTLVRHDPAQTMRETQTWSVLVTDPVAANLRLSGMSLSQNILPAGSDVDVTVTVHNDGPAAAADFDVETFLSIDNVVQTTDLYVGKSHIALLPAGQQMQLVRRFRVPAFTLPRFYSTIAIADRPGAVFETLETDNVAFAGMLVQPGGCGPTLEYRDDLLYPRDSGGVSIAQGGVLLPTVTAPCAAPGTFYLIAWSCSGTSPGTPMAPGVLVPLNADAFTLVGLEHLNGSVFQVFAGLLDADGVGRAALAWPPGLLIGPTPGHFAAVLMDLSPAFLAASNPVAFVLQ
jgi:hypothetical protein